MFDPDEVQWSSGYRWFSRVILPHFIKSKLYKELYQATTEITNNIRLRIARLNIRKNGCIKFLAPQQLTGGIGIRPLFCWLLCLQITTTIKKLNYFWSNWCLFSRGEMYSRRLLSNYYANRVLLHSKENELIKAEYFGFSFIKSNDDTLVCE
jgi:hypothetical protein